jgi:HEPN domain-containing protein
VRLDVEPLVKQAERDLEHARKNLRVKAAWMMHRREAPPRTHSLTELADGLGVPSTLRPKFAYLNPDYTTARYPDAANAARTQRPRPASRHAARWRAAPATC